MLRHPIASSLAAPLAAVLLAPAALAHVTLETQQAVVDAPYKAVLRVPHGCKGSPTVRVRVQIPEGVVGVKPQPKPGWTLEIARGNYAQPHALYGAQVRSGVREIAWSGGRLPDEQYDEFVFVGYLSASLSPGTTLHFPVVQECEQGVERWIDKPPPEADASASHAGTPAPALKLLPRQ